MSKLGRIRICISWRSDPFFFFMYSWIYFGNFLNTFMMNFYWLIGQVYNDKPATRELTEQQKIQEIVEEMSKK